MNEEDGGPCRASSPTAMRLCLPPIRLGEWEGAVMDYQFWVIIGFWIVVCLLSHRDGKRAGKREAADTLTQLRVLDEESTGYHSTTAHRLCERLRHWARTGEIDDG